MRGRLSEAFDVLDEGIVLAERGLLRLHAFVRLHATAARNRIAAGALQAAEDALREASEASARHGDCAACDASFRPEAVRVLLARGRIDEAEEEASQLLSIADRRRSAVLEALAEISRARVLAARGAGPEALAALERARSAFLESGHRYEAARCARLEVRLHGGAEIPDEVRALDSLVTVDLDA
jgi:tetratricopeptide (TPR) repeat protein